MAGLRFLEKLQNMQKKKKLPDDELANAVVKSVIGYVGKILNTRRGSTVLGNDFGIPDFTGMGVSFSADDIPHLENEIATFIERCEPRLKQVSVTFSPDKHAHFQMQFLLSANLDLGINDYLPVHFTTKIEPSGKVQVSM